MIMSEVNHRAFYGAFFKTWAVKSHGPLPTNEQLGIAHNLGCRPGKQALAIGMSLRDVGVTAGQIQHACGAPQRHRMGGLADDALLKRVPMPKVDGVYTVYKHVVTPKGQQRIDRTVKASELLEAAGKAEGEVVVKPKVKKATSTPRKPKAPPVITVADMPPVAQAVVTGQAPDGVTDPAA
jgi:hypothetical protein